MVSLSSCKVSLTQRQNSLALSRMRKLDCRIAAALAVGVLPFATRAAVTFEFKDVVPDGNPDGPNGITIHPGDKFSFDIWLQAQGEKVAGVSFRLHFDQYGSTAPKTFTFVPYESGVVMLDRGTSPFTDLSNSPGSGLELMLTPENENDLGALIPISDSPGWRTGQIYIGKATLQTDAAMPLTTSTPYTLSPSSLFPASWTEWTETGGVGHDIDPGSIGYSVNVVPEPSQYAAVGALGLLGFAAYRRFARGQSNKA